ncbi:MAG TPA: methylamine utilization protein [Steroidobacteraceae bacterium]
MSLAPRLRCGLLLLAVLGGTSALASNVAVTVRTASGAAAEDALIVFEPRDAAPLPGKATVVIDQVNKRFVPRVTILRTGTAVTFPNSDNIRHQVYSFSPAKSFDLKLYAGSPKEEVIFDKPGLVILGCNIHDTMVGFVAVVDSPYFGKVPSSGEVALDLPPGHYALRVWHTNLAAPLAPKEITVGAAAQAISLVIDLDAKRESVAPWP